MTEYNLLKKKYELGKSAFGSVKNLSEATNLPQYKVDQFLQTQAAATKYRQFRKKYPRLKVIVNDINEIWSVDVAYMDKLSKYNRNYKYLSVAVDCISRYLRVEPMQNKFAADALKAFKNMIKKKKPKKVWVDDGTEFKGVSKDFCEKNNVHIYKTFSEKNSAFAERNIRSLKNIVYKYLEYKWTYSYIDKLQEFVKTINSRVNRVTKLAPNKVNKSHVTYLKSLTTNSSAKQVRRPKLKVGDFVRISKTDLPFRKGYKQTFTDEVFEIFDIPTVDPPTYSLIDAVKEPVRGKFYEAELIQVSVFEDQSTTG